MAAASGDALPTGEDLYAAYLQPLSQTLELEAVIQTSAAIRNISRLGIDKVVTTGRTNRTVRVNH
jgi:hypothetical protein